MPTKWKLSVGPEGVRGNMSKWNKSDRKIKGRNKIKGIKGRKSANIGFSFAVSMD